MAGRKTVRKNLGDLEHIMITKRIDNLTTEQWPWIMGNIVNIFVIESSTPSSITATGDPAIWDKISLPENATVTVVEDPA